jgi:alkylhydroperoxidase family enzyme
VDAVLENPETAPISPAEKALLAFIREVNGHSFELDRGQIERLQSVGWSDEAIYDAVTVCALFNFYNRWCDGTGVSAMTPEAHLAGGKRLAQYGYAPPASPPPGPG